ncbi:DUF6284 family protein, partial [Streptomyces sp. WAC05950]|uniref:DUF6284 family protein n=1 Tax=Streptomyces sp. WAC05950 TaxID=2487419 RepID=UPI0028B0B881
MRGAGNPLHPQRSAAPGAGTPGAAVGSRSSTEGARPVEFIAALQNLVTPWSDDLEPSVAELEAIEIELPLILAERDLLDAQIMT